MRSLLFATIFFISISPHSWTTLDGFYVTQMSKHLTKDGRAFNIGRPDENDAEKIINYSKLLFSSTDQLLTTFEEYTKTINEQKIWINESLQRTASIILIAELSEEVVGLLFFAPLPRRKNRHSGEFGVSVHPAYQGIGVGRKLIEEFLKWARENGEIEKVFLNVFATNTNAIELYKSLGFVEEGRHIKAIKQITGTYVDIIQMYIMTK